MKELTDKAQNHECHHDDANMTKSVLKQIDIDGIKIKEDIEGAEDDIAELQKKRVSKKKALDEMKENPHNVSM